LLAIAAITPLIIDIDFHYFATPRHWPRHASTPLAFSADIDISFSP
jgi:hypothetical protein